MVWYYVKDGARQGPVDEAEFDRLVGQKIVKPETLVWSEGMSDWRPYSALAPAPAPAPPAPVESRPEPRIEYRPEPAPEPVTPAAAQPMVTIDPAPAPAEVPYQPVAAVPAPAPEGHFCTNCGRQYPDADLVRFGTALVCANCKDLYAQRLRETGTVAGTRVYGGFWIRFAAVFIDGIALWIVNFALQSVMSTRITNPGDLSNLPMIMSSIGINFTISIALQLLYESFFLVQYGATPGKMIFKLKVITPEGGPITWGRAIGRYFAKILSGITLLIGYIMAAFDSEKRALHDYIAGTRVIRTV